MTKEQGLKKFKTVLLASHITFASTAFGSATLAFGLERHSWWLFAMGAASIVVGAFFASLMTPIAVMDLIAEHYRIENDDRESEVGE